MKPKFRAWNTNSGRFAKDGELFLVIDSENYNLYSVDFDTFRLENDNYILMQSTGLKDKNGVEIFEGDIVETPSTKAKYLVDYIEGSLVGRIDYSEYLTLYKGLKVIGNIYEDSNLI